MLEWVMNMKRTEEAPEDLGGLVALAREREALHERVGALGRARGALLSLVSTVSESESREHGSLRGDSPNVSSLSVRCSGCRTRQSLRLMARARGTDIMSPARSHHGRAGAAMSLPSLGHVTCRLIRLAAIGIEMETI